jgi:hypothetical protein
VAYTLLYGKMEQEEDSALNEAIPMFDHEAIQILSEDGRRSRAQRSLRLEQ